MEKIMNGIAMFLVVGILFTGTFLSGNSTRAVLGDGNFDVMEELEEGSFYTLKDKDSGEELEYLNRRCFEDDMIILGDNRIYRIHKADHENYAAHCERLDDFVPEDLAVSVWNEQKGQNQAIAIYATHSDECYVPTSGTESKTGGGDILQVAGALAEELEKEGLEVLHSENVHDPHDSKAYDRSRETATDLLREGSAAMIIDIHRDGIPDPEYYEAQMNGQEITQIRLVVGRANENSEENIAFAKRLKAYYDKVKPGLIKSIYMAKGHYNQDLAPQAVLLEVGTHTNSLEEAQAGIKEFGEALPEFLGLQGAQGTLQSDGTAEKDTQSQNGEQSNENRTQQNRAGFGTMFFIIIILAAIGGGIYYFVSRKA